MVELIDKLADTPNEDLAEALGRIEAWRWPRSDLNAWVKVLNKFDAILEEAIRDYDIDKMQMNPFTPSTKKLICEVLRFERLLLENSTNRKTFNSYDVRPISVISGLCGLTSLAASQQLHGYVRFGRPHVRSQPPPPTCPAVFGTTSSLACAQHLDTALDVAR